MRFIPSRAFFTSSTVTHFALGGVVLTLAALTGCNGLKKADDEAPAAPSARSYSGTASVGDFLTVSLDPVTQMMDYKNTTNGQHYSVGYTLASDGTYTFADPTGNLVSGYELPGYAMVLEANKAGPNADTPALITAIQTTTVTTAVFRDKEYNYMQFRTNSGGIEVGHVTADIDGNISPNGYWPFGALDGRAIDKVFSTGVLPTTGVVPNADNSALILSMTDGGMTETNYVFATTGGFLAVDTPNGAIVCMQARTSGDFDAATMAGRYQAILYQKNGCHTGMGNVETSTSQDIVKGTVTFSATGTVTVIGENGVAIVTDAPLTKFADRADLHGPGKVESACNGFFTFTTTDSGVTRDVFVAFMDRSILLSSFVAHPGGMGSGTYDYFYGMGLKTAATGTASLPNAASTLGLATIK